MLNEIVSKLDALSSVANQIEPNESVRNEWTQKAVDYCNDFINRMRGMKSFYQHEPDGLSLENKRHSFDDLLEKYQKEVVETGILAASGGHVGYIPTGGIYASAIADYIAAVTNPYAGAYFASPGAVSIENECVNWLKKVFSFPENSVGNLTSGGSISQLIALTAARDKYGIKNEKIKSSVVYLSEQVHHSVQKALRIIGLEDIIIRKIALDDGFRMKPEELEKLIKEDLSKDLNPFLVIASAGTTDTGAIDPMDEIAAISHQYKLWLHIDAAYGGFFILSSKKDLFKGIEKADSLIVDPHKGMFLPYGLGAVLIKDVGAALHSHFYTANYMQDTYHEEMVKSPANLSPELSKHFRGLRMWLPLQLHGIEPFIANWEEKILLTHYFRERLSNLGFSLGPEPDLSVSFFWYPFGKDEDENNKRLMEEMHKDGSVFLSSSVIGGRFVIRMAVLSFRTKKETIDRAVDMIERSLKKVKVAG